MHAEPDSNWVEDAIIELCEPIIHMLGTLDGRLWAYTESGWHELYRPLDRLEIN